MNQYSLIKFEEWQKNTVWDDILKGIVKDYVPAMARWLDLGCGVPLYLDGRYYYYVGVDSCKESIIRAKKLFENRSYAEFYHLDIFKDTREIIGIPTYLSKANYTPKNFIITAFFSIFHGTERQQLKLIDQLSNSKASRIILAVARDKHVAKGDYFMTGVEAKYTHLGYKAYIPDGYTVSKLIPASRTANSTPFVFLIMDKADKKAMELKHMGQLNLSTQHDGQRITE